MINDRRDFKAMKTLLKILLPLAVVGIVYFVIIKPTNVTTPPTTPKDISSPPSGQCSTLVETEIKSFSARDSGSTYGEDRGFYQKIKDHIGDCHEKHYFSKFTSVSKDCRDTLTGKLVDVYRDKFVRHASSMFENSECEINDLKSIRSEYQELRRELRKKGGSVLSETDSLFAKIHDIIQVYDAVDSMINACRDFSAQTGADFPMDSVKNVIETAKKYKDMTFNFGNKFVGLCERTKDTLEEIPRILFDKHVAFLDKKIDASSETYGGFDVWREYYDTVLRDVRNEINALYMHRVKYVNNGVDPDDFRRKYNELKARWDEEYAGSVNYFNYRKKIIEYLQGNKLDEYKLMGYRDSVDKYAKTEKLKASINYCLEFWKLDGSKGKKYSDLLSEVLKDDNLKDSKLRFALQNVLIGVKTYDRITDKEMALSRQ